MSRYTSCVDLHLLLRDEQRRVLLGRRQNTGFADGAWHLPAGHLEEGESVTAGMAREAVEELGIEVRRGDLALVHTMHHFTDSGRIALFFEASAWRGEVTNREPDKCAGWSWWSVDALPAQMIPYAAEALRHIAGQNRFSERGW